MPSLEVKNMPNDLYEAILDNARNENQTPDQAAITLLRNGLSSANKQKKKIQIIFQKIDEINLGDTSSFPSPESLIREDGFEEIDQEVPVALHTTRQRPAGGQ